jgi:RNA polymerase sigma-70 factor, ECF subfamily
MLTSYYVSFNDLVSQYWLPLANAAYHLCGDRDAVNDIVQNTFIDAYKEINQLTDPAATRTKLYSILRNRALDHLNKQSNKPKSKKLFIPVAAENAQAIVSEIFVDQMFKLSREDREILAGLYFLELTHHEVATALGISDHSVKTRSTHAKELLGATLTGSGAKIPTKHK